MTDTPTVTTETTPATPASTDASSGKEAEMNPDSPTSILAAQDAAEMADIGKIGEEAEKREQATEEVKNDLPRIPMPPAFSNNMMWALATESVNVSLSFDDATRRFRGTCPNVDEFAGSFMAEEPDKFSITINKLIRTKWLNKPMPLDKEAGEFLAAIPKVVQYKVDAGLENLSFICKNEKGQSKELKFKKVDPEEMTRSVRSRRKIVKRGDTLKGPVTRLGRGESSDGLPSPNNASSPTSADGSPSPTPSPSSSGTAAASASASTSSTTSTGSAGSPTGGTGRFGRLIQRGGAHPAGENRIDVAAALEKLFIKPAGGGDAGSSASSSDDGKAPSSTSSSSDSSTSSASSSSSSSDSSAASASTSSASTTSEASKPAESTAAPPAAS